MKPYDNCKPSKYISYLGPNILYGWAMSQYLPDSEFRWLTLAQINEFDMILIPKDEYILKVDLEYPEELHDLLNHYPLTPKQLEIKRDVL